MNDRDLTIPVWQREQLFPAKPDSAPYGYITHKKASVEHFTLKEFQQGVLNERDGITAVWTPTDPNCVLLEEVPELLEVLKSRTQRLTSEDLQSDKRTLFIFGSVFSIYLVISIINRGVLFYHDNTTLGIMTIMLVLFGLKPVYESWKALQAAKALNQQKLTSEALDARFDVWMEQQPAIVSKVLIIVLIIMSVLQFLVPHPEQFKDGFHFSTQVAGLKNNRLMDGAAWRVWTAPFLHGGFLHLFFNCSSLWFLGKRIENLARWPHFVMAFIFSAVAGSYCSIYFLPVGKVGVGASGGVMGLLGFLYIFELLHPRLAPKPARRRLIAGFITMLIIGLLGYNFIDNAAHIGGLIGGSLYAVIAFHKTDSVRRPIMRKEDWILGISSAAISMWAIFYAVLKITQLG